MLRNGVNYNGLYGNSRTCFGVENKGHKLNKNSLPCLLDILLVFVCHIFSIFSTIPVGFRFTEHFPRSISCYICPQKVGHFSSNSILSNKLQRKERISIKGLSRTKDCGPRTGYKRRTNPRV